MSATELQRLLRLSMSTSLRKRKDVQGPRLEVEPSQECPRGEVQIMIAVQTAAAAGGPGVRARVHATRSVRDAGTPVPRDVGAGGATHARGRGCLGVLMGHMTPRRR